MADLTISDVQEIKTFLADTCDELLRWLPGDGWQPGFGSEAASELANAQTHAGVAWGEAPVRTAYAAAALFIFAAIDCLKTMADSIELLTVPYVPNVLARAAMEASAQTWWLLEPRIGARRRVIRSVLVRANSARYLGQAVRKTNPKSRVSDFGEDQTMVTAYAASLGLTYVCNKDRVECESDALQGYNERAGQFERAMRMIAAYKIYSGAAHAELYSVVQGWRDVSAPGAPTPRWEKRPDREAVWATVIAAAGFATVPEFRALVLLGRNARLAEMIYSMRRLGKMTRRLGLPPDWAY